MSTFQVYALAGFGAVSATVVVAVLLWFVFKAAVRAAVGDRDRDTAYGIESLSRNTASGLEAVRDILSELSRRVSAIEAEKGKKR